MDWEKELKKGYFTLVVIGVAMMLSVVIYAVVAEFVARQNEPFTGFVGGFDKLDTLRYILLAISVVELGISGIIRKALLSDTLASFMTRQSGPSFGSRPVYQQFISTNIIIFALCESVAVYGLVLFLMAGSRLDLYLFIAISLAGYAVYFPRYSHMRAWMAKRMGVQEEPTRPNESHTTYDERTGKYRR